MVAYASCPGGIDAARGVAGEGLLVRNVMRPGLAAPGAAAGWRFDAPAGTTITGVAFDARVLRNPGWQAGLQDAAADRWLWCGNACSTSVGHWVHDEVRGLSTSRLATLVRCVASYCRRERLRAFVGLRNVRVTLSDPAPPVARRRSRGVRRRLAPRAGRGRRRRARRDRDPGRARRPRRPRRPRRHPPLRLHPAGALLRRRAPRGVRHADVEPTARTGSALGVSDAGGSWSWRERIVRVDNTPPPEPVVALDGGAGWSSSPARTLRVTLPADRPRPSCARG